MDIYDGIFSNSLFIEFFLLIALTPLLRQVPDVFFSPEMPLRLDQVSSNFSEGSKDLVLEGRIPERGQGNQISVQLKDAYGMVALSIKADLTSMLLEIGNNYVVQFITQYPQIEIEF